ncbi:MAG: Spy/CpxP family protein refolding chaperone [Terriglobia bacterium]
MGERKGILASSLLVLLFLSLGSIAWGSNPGMSGDRSRVPQDRLGVDRLLALLDSDRIRTYLRLEDPQVERLRHIVLETQKANVKTRAEIEVRGIELREALRAVKPERDEILKKAQEISDLRGEMMKHNVEAILAAKAVLSPEQQKKVFFILENRYEGGSVGEEPRGMRAKPLPGPSVPPPPIPLHPGEPPVQ